MRAEADKAMAVLGRKPRRDPRFRLKVRAGQIDIVWASLLKRLELVSQKAVRSDKQLVSPSGSVGFTATCEDSETAHEWILKLAQGSMKTTRKGLMVTVLVEADEVVFVWLKARQIK